MNKWLRLFGFILLCQFAGIIGSVFTMPKIASWYSTLQMPWFTPPNWIFGPVWTTLFALMGISLYLLWEKKSDKRFKLAMVIFGVQFALNILWNFMFFGLESPFLGLVEIAFLWASIAMTIATFYMISKKAGTVLIPYILWVSIATALNYYVLILN
ncbi:MAG: TspO/MBR family protein [Candidatus Aenigmatarchaeota archaeon]